MEDSFFAWFENAAQDPPLWPLACFSIITLIGCAFWQAIRTNNKSWKYYEFCWIMAVIFLSVGATFAWATPVGLCVLSLLYLLSYILMFMFVCVLAVALAICTLGLALVEPNADFFSPIVFVFLFGILWIMLLCLIISMEYDRKFGHHSDKKGNAGPKEKYEYVGGTYIKKVNAVVGGSNHCKVSAFQRYWVYHYIDNKMYNMEKFDTYKAAKDYVNSKSGKWRNLPGEHESKVTYLCEDGSIVNKMSNKYSIPRLDEATKSNGDNE